MKLKIWLIVAFAIVAIAQLFVPYKMISRQAEIAQTGNEFKFKIRHNRWGATIRGNFISLQFDADKFKIKDKKDWENSQSVFVTFDKDSLGFARVHNVTKEKPLDSKDWVKARAILMIRDSTSNKRARARNLINYIDYSYLQLNYPFDKYNIEDTNAKGVGISLSEKMRDSLCNFTLDVKILENKFLAGDLKLDSVTFREFVKGLGK
jgi:hypothetical protein